MAYSSPSLTDTLEKLKKTVEEARREIKELTVTALRVEGPEKRKLENGLKKVEKQIEVLDIHIGDINCP